MHATAIRGRCVPASGENPDLGKGFFLPLEEPAQFIQGPEQVPLDVVVKSLEGRDIKDARVLRCPLPCQELVNAPEKGCKGFAAPGGGADENMLSFCNRRPGLFLKIGRFPEPLEEPAGNERMKGIHGL